jgi:RNA ligase (TIGR02306 family)
MSTFSVPVVKIRAIEPIAGADAIEAAVIGEYRSVIRKGQYEAGDLAVYIPEDSIVPEDILVELGLEGKLAGSHKNRVKPVTLRGCLSQGILYPIDNAAARAGDVKLDVDVDVAELLGITKWEPPIPTYMSGDVYYAGKRLTVDYDIENFKKYPDVIETGETVSFTEKIHGTFLGIGILPDVDHDPKHYRNKFVVFSKGYGAQGLAFKDSDTSNGNVYIRACEALNLFDKLESAKKLFESEAAEHNDPRGFSRPLYILGEVFGASVQDLTYGMPLSFRAFDVVSGYRYENQVYFGVDGVQQLCKLLQIDTVPELFRGPFSPYVLKKYTAGKETVSGTESHMREGIVIRLLEERSDPNIGRVILKSVSDDYLNRKGGTEYR